MDDEHEIADLVELYLKKREFYRFQILYRKEAWKVLDKSEIDLAILGHHASQAQAPY